ncbi:MAG: preprotein translocase subunit SecE [Candidatus Eremiobacteraeota bacterium]|nr:preprotein translocase subunit SecE [Candidatus Eremiobacteraeota bacterium]MBV8354182.1 preprotein translocase subunit SecE [Candidatus Eremiobacteraeota bacterium]
MAERTINRPPGRQTPTTTRTERAQRGRAYIEGLISEMRRVTWPTRQEWVSATVLTVALVIGVAVFTSACDWIFTQIFSLLRGGPV